MNPLVSIGIPVKNGFLGKTEKDINLEKALNSILNQSYTNLEIIISNNCSTDKTSLFLDEMSKKDKRIKIFHQTNQIMAGENFQFVLNKAKGEYFKWNAADDMISSDFIEQNLDFLEKNLDFSCSSSKFYFEDLKEKIYSHNLSENLYERIKHFFHIKFKSHNIFFSLIRKEHVIKTIAMSKDYLACDWMIALNLLLSGKFKTIEKGYIILGAKGFSRSEDLFKRKSYNNKIIYKILPYYELTKDFFRLTLFSKRLSILEKIILYLLCLKANLSFLKKKYRNKFKI